MKLLTSSDNLAVLLVQLLHVGVGLAVACVDPGKPALADLAHEWAGILGERVEGRDTVRDDERADQAEVSSKDRGDSGQCRAEAPAEHSCECSGDRAEQEGRRERATRLILFVDVVCRLEQLVSADDDVWDCRPLTALARGIATLGSKTFSRVSSDDIFGCFACKPRLMTGGTGCGS